MKPRLTVLTDPVPDGLQALYEYGYRFLRLLRNSISRRSLTRNTKYGGHFSVTRSLVEGLPKIGADFNYNPSSAEDLFEIVHVVGGVRALQQMIQFKKIGRIKKLFAGPNITVFSTDAESILAAPEIDGVVNHCDFACELWAVDHPELLNRCFRWPAGVDTQYWLPNHTKGKKTILIFDKRRVEDDPMRIRPYVKYLCEQGWGVEVIARCGELGYRPEEYRALLQKSALMVGFTVGSESQGIAWAEAWSCDVPTLILRNTRNTYQGRSFSCTTAPFLTPHNGLFFDDLEDFKIQFYYWQTHRDQFTPRAWVLENMSDEVSARLLYQHVTGERI